MEDKRNFHVTFKRQRGEGYVARCIELPGCLSEGRTKAEALRNIQDAIKLYTEDVEAEAKAKKQVEQIKVGTGILNKPASLAKDWVRISERVAKKWPKKVSSVQAIAVDRDRK